MIEMQCVCYSIKCVCYGMKCVWYDMKYMCVYELKDGLARLKTDSLK